MNGLHINGYPSAFQALSDLFVLNSKFPYHCCANLHFRCFQSVDVFFTQGPVTTFIQNISNQSNQIKSNGFYLRVGKNLLILVLHTRELEDDNGKTKTLLPFTFQWKAQAFPREFLLLNVFMYVRSYSPGLFIKQGNIIIS